MKLPTFLYYLALLFQILGLAIVGICFASGLMKGDYGKIELYEFLGGSLLFYLSHFLRKGLSQR